MVSKKSCLSQERASFPSKSLISTICAPRTSELELELEQFVVCNNMLRHSEFQFSGELERIR